MKVPALVETVARGGGALQLEFLSQKPLDFEPPVNGILHGMPVDEFAMARMTVPIFSDVLQEKIYFVSDNARINTGRDGRLKGCIVYRARELRELLGASAELIRSVHEAKKQFGGEVIG